MAMLNYGLVLEGGGLRGNFTAGVLDAFLEKGIEFPFVIGVSAGAGMGCSLVSKQHGRNLRILKEFRNDPRYLSVRSFLKTGNYFGLDFIYDDIPTKYVPFDMEAFLASPVRFIAVSTDCGTGKAAYFEKGPDALQAMKASAAMPYVSRMVSFRGGKYLDGGISDAIPLRKTIAEGYTKNVAVLTHPAGYRRKKEHHPPPRLFYRTYPRLVEALETYVDRYNDDLAFVEAEAEAGRCVLIRPPADFKVSRTEKDVGKLLRLYEYGLQAGYDALTRIM